jgi:hypothetical protein
LSSLAILYECALIVLIRILWHLLSLSKGILYSLKDDSGVDVRWLKLLDLILQRICFQNGVM